MKVEQIKDSSRLFPDIDKIKDRQDYWAIPTKDFLLHHPKAARWLINGFLILGTINLSIIAYFLYIKFSHIAGIVMAIIVVLYFIAVLKQAKMFNTFKHLTIYDVYMRKN